MRRLCRQLHEEHNSLDIIRLAIGTEWKAQISFLWKVNDRMIKYILNFNITNKIPYHKDREKESLCLLLTSRKSGNNLSFLIKNKWIFEKSTRLQMIKHHENWGQEIDLFKLGKAYHFHKWSEPDFKIYKHFSLPVLRMENLITDNSSGHTTESYLWQSFDYLTDTLLPDMKLGWDLKTDLKRCLSSWESDDDPSPGKFTNGLDIQVSPKLLTFNGSVNYTCTGQWNGVAF